MPGLSGEQVRWLLELRSGPDRLPDHVAAVLAAWSYITVDAQGYAHLTRGGRRVADRLALS